MAEKSFFANLLKFIVNGSNTSDKNISAQQAIQLQKEYMDNLKQDKNTLASPPYVEIAKQLNNKNSEIFQAAVYYLMRISENKHQYALPILSILKHCKQKNKLSEKDMSYLCLHIEKLEQLVKK